MTITKEQYLMVAGLLTIGHYHWKRCEEAQKVLQEMLEPGEENGSGHTMDAMLEGYTVDELLKRLGVSVD